MFSYIQIVLAALGVAREVLRYVNKSQDLKIEKVKKARDFRDALRKANENGKTTDIERAFSDLKLLDK